MKNCINKIIYFGLVFMMIFIVKGQITTYALEINQVSDSIVITSQPTSVTGKIGDAVEFKVGATGTNLRYQWQYIIKGQNSWKNFDNGNASTMKKVLGESYEDLKVRVVITDGNGNSVASDTVMVTLKKELAITSQPTSVTGKIGDAVEFKVGATGTNLRYQWQYIIKGQNSWKNFDNGNASIMKKVLGESYEDLKVRVVITDGNGKSVASDTVMVTLKKELAITSQPTSVTGKIGDAVEFKVGATGTNLRYQWQYIIKGQNSWKNFDNGNASTMKKVLGESYEDLKVRVVITDGNGNSVASDTVMVTLKKELAITSQPTSVTGKIGDAVEFKVGATGTNLRYQWQYIIKGQNSWKNFDNGNASTMKKVLGESYEDLKVRVVITDGNGKSVASDTVMVTLKKELAITSQPTSVTGKIGDAVEFKVGATGTNLRYQWQYIIKGQNSWKNFDNGNASTMKKVLGESYEP